MVNDFVNLGAELLIQLGDDAFNCLDCIVTDDIGILESLTDKGLYGTLHCGLGFC